MLNLIECQILIGIRTQEFSFHSNLRPAIFPTDFLYKKTAKLETKIQKLPTNILNILHVKSQKHLTPIFPTIKLLGNQTIINNLVVYRQSFLLIQIIMKFK